MKKIFTLVFSMLLATAAVGQSKLNPAGRHALNRYKSERVVSRGMTDSVPVTAMIVRMAEGSTPSLLEEAGYEVTADLGPIAVVRARITDADSLAAMTQVRSLSFGEKRRLLMNAARAVSGVDEAHKGISNNGSTNQFTGDGVILGLMDGGLYPNHINFENRVERLWHFSGDDGTSKEYTATTVGQFSTDDKQETHATHVAGIMGGGYRGTATFKNSTTTTTGPMPHYGVAPDAALAFSCGELWDPNIIQGVKNIIDYAEEQGKPAAINLSLGSNSGPHDGTDDFSVALDELGKRALISVSAGNEGADNMSIEKTFTSSDKTVKTILYYNNLYSTGVAGLLDIWSSDGRPLTVKIGTANSSGSISNETTIPTSTNDEELTLSKGVSASYGDVSYYSGVDANSGRHNVYLYFDSSRPSTGRFAITVTGAAGQTVNMYFEGYTEFTNKYNPSGSALSGYTAGTPDNSINGMGCGSNVLTVGAYSTTNSWRTLGGTSGSTSESVGAHASFSSYGHDFSGRQLPEIAAPGTAIMSSFSPAYVDGGYGDDYGESADDMVVSAKSSRGTDYWGPMEGTSMSCPFVTGTLALWLQADPTLTIDDVRDVLKNTSTTDSYTSAAPERFGYGKINAARGLEYILAKASLGTVTADGRSVSVIATSSGFDITVAGASGLSASLYDLQGRTVASASSADNRLSVNAAGLAQGIYLLKVTGDNLNYSEKVILRHQ